MVLPLYNLLRRRERREEKGSSKGPKSNDGGGGQWDVFVMEGPPSVEAEDESDEDGKGEVGDEVGPLDDAQLLFDEYEGLCFTRKPSARINHSTSIRALVNAPINFGKSVGQQMAKAPQAVGRQMVKAPQAVGRQLGNMASNVGAAASMTVVSVAQGVTEGLSTPLRMVSSRSMRKRLGGASGSSLVSSSTGESSGHSGRHAPQQAQEDLQEGGSCGQGGTANKRGGGGGGGGGGMLSQLGQTKARDLIQRRLSRLQPLRKVQSASATPGDGSSVTGGGTSTGPSPRPSDGSALPPEQAAAAASAGGICSSSFIQHQQQGGADPGTSAFAAAGVQSGAVMALPPSGAGESEAEVVSYQLAVLETDRLDIENIMGTLFVNQYVVITSLGAGTFGKVKLGLNLYDEELYAIKLMNKHRNKRRKLGKVQRLGGAPGGGGGLDGNDGDSMRNEVEVMKKLRHPNLVKLYEVIDDPDSDKLLLVMEYVEGGALLSLENAPGEKVQPMAEATARKYFRGVVKGLDYLHRNMITHGDLKPENLLLSADGHVKIADFGSSRLVAAGETMYRTVGTPAYLAPEVCAGQPFHGRRADVWALGVTLYMLMTGRAPFKGKSVGSLYDAIQNQEVSFPDDEVPLSAEAKAVIRAMLTKRADARVTLEEVAAHEWTTENGALPSALVDEPSEEEEDGFAQLQSLSTAAMSRGAKAPTLALDTFSRADVRWAASERRVQGELREYIQFESHPAESWIVQNGDPMTRLYYIREGVCELWHGGTYGNGERSGGRGDSDLEEEVDEDDEDEEGDGGVDDASPAFGKRGSAGWRGGQPPPGMSERSRRWASRVADSSCGDRSSIDEGLSFTDFGSMTQPTVSWGNLSALQHPQQHLMAMPSTSGGSWTSPANSLGLGPSAPSASAHSATSSVAGAPHADAPLITIRRGGEFLVGTEWSLPGQTGLLDSWADGEYDDELWQWDFGVRCRTDVELMSFPRENLRKALEEKPHLRLDLQATIARSQAEALRSTILEKLSLNRTQLEGFEKRMRIRAQSLHHTYAKSPSAIGLAAPASPSLAGGSSSLRPTVASAAEPATPFGAAAVPATAFGDMPSTSLEEAVQAAAASSVPVMHSSSSVSSGGSFHTSSSGTMAMMAHDSSDGPPVPGEGPVAVAALHGADEEPDRH